MEIIMRLVSMAVALTLCSSPFCSDTDSVVHEQNRYNLPIIHENMAQYFANKKIVKIDVTVEDATGRGEKALDFFTVEPNGQLTNIPTSLSDILVHSEFLKSAINTLLQNGSGTLKISESLSEPGHSGRISGFIGITQDDIK